MEAGSVGGLEAGSEAGLEVGCIMGRQGQSHSSSAGLVQMHQLCHTWEGGLVVDLEAAEEGDCIAAKL